MKFTIFLYSQKTKRFYHLCSVPGERDGGDGYRGQGESAEGPRHAGHHLQLPGPSVCEDRQTCVNVSKKSKTTDTRHKIQFLKVTKSVFFTDFGDLSVRIPSSGLSRN